jgi:hypothetical protein
MLIEMKCANIIFWVKYILETWASYDQSGN